MLNRLSDFLIAAGMHLQKEEMTPYEASNIQTIADAPV